MKKITLSIFSMLMSIGLIAQTTIYSEDFTSQNGKGAVGGTTVTYDTSSVNWNIIVNEAGLTATTDWFQVQSEMFEARDIDSIQVWQSNPVSISGYTNISLSVFAQEVGGHEPNDFIDVEYSTDGGATYTKVINYNGLGDASHTLVDDFDTATVMVSNVSGTSLVFRISVLNGAGSEYIMFDNLIATGNLAGSMFANITSSTNASCFGGADGSATVTVSNGTANYTYSWSNGATTIGTASTTDMISGLVAGTYTVTVTDGNSNTATSTATIAEPSQIISNLTIVDASCAGASDGSINASSTGGSSPYTYMWSNSFQGSMVSNLVAGNYSVTTVDANGCSTTDMAMIGEPSALALVFDSLVSPKCFGDNNGSAIAKATGGTSPYTFNWSTGTQDIQAASIAAQSFESSATDTWSYTEFPVTYNTSGDVWAIDGSRNSLNPTDGTNFWFMSDINNSNGGGAFKHTLTFASQNISSFSNVKIEFDWGVNGFDTGDDMFYEVFEDGVSLGEVQFVDGNSNFTSSGTESIAISSSATTCYIVLKAEQNGSDYGFFDNVRITADADTLSSKETAMASGNFSVTLTDASGCTISASSSVPSTNRLRSDIIMNQNVSMVGANDGSLRAYASGGTNPYTYLWSNAMNTENISNLAAGTYDLTVTDANGCTESSSISIGGSACPADITPSNLNEKFITSTSAVLDWDELIGGTNVYYLVRYKESGQANWQTLFTTTVDSLVINGLTPNTSYLYIVKANCNGIWSGQAFHYFRTLSNDCSTPSGMNEQWVLGTKAKLTWNADLNTSQYQVRYKDSIASTWNMVNVNASFTYLWLNSLSNNTTYEWQIRSTCRFDEATATIWSPTRSFTTGGSSLPAQTSRMKGEETSDLSQVEKNSLEFYPNPTSGQVNITFHELSSDRIIEILDLRGRVVHKESIESNTYTVPVEISHLNNGVYFLRVVNQSDKLFKIVLQK